LSIGCEVSFFNLAQVLSAPRLVTAPLRKAPPPPRVVDLDVPTASNVPAKKAPKTAGPSNKKNPVAVAQSSNAPYNPGVIVPLCQKMWAHYQKGLKEGIIIKIKHKEFKVSFCGNAVFICWYFISVSC
jgi:hypothetical protein